MKSLDHSRLGFTLIESLIGIAILSLLFSFGISGISHLSKRLVVMPSDTYLENIFTTAARRARDGVNNASWGIYLPYDETSRTLNEVVVFQGDSYSTRNPGFDQSFQYPNKTLFNAVILSGFLTSDGNDHEIIFETHTGATEQYGSIEIEVYGVIRTLIVTEDGFVNKEL